ncbi:MAG: hypothetical protein IT425_00665 [Pirellulales bacterium]|nr:hypothetical protein [Pirellulales bacterium]
MPRKRSKKRQPATTTKKSDLRNPTSAPDPTADWAFDDFDDGSELEEDTLDEACWEAFLADDDELDPDPEYGDFWPNND